MDTSSQRVAAALSRMQERQGLRSRAARRLDLVLTVRELEMAATPVCRMVASL